MAFRFRQFNVADDESSMKVGTDAVLLGAWAEKNNPINILDIGTGSGLIALMMAQRYESAQIHAIDLHAPSIKQSKENFSQSPWNKRLCATHISLQKFALETQLKFDLVVSNPPYFTNSLLPPNPAKQLARHTETLSYLEIAEGVSKLMHPEACFCLILPYENHDVFEKHANSKGLYMSRQLRIIPVTGKAPNRLLSAWKFHPSPVISDSLTIRNEDQTYSEAYKQLTRNFYLAL
jgi:tRNA1Val (adenine37-N6)-methyltransferase